MDEGRAKISSASRITNGVGDIAGFVLSVKAIIDLAVQISPRVSRALLWSSSERSNHCPSLRSVKTLAALRRVEILQRAITAPGTLHQPAPARTCTPRAGQTDACRCRQVASRIHALQPQEQEKQA